MPEGNEDSFISRLQHDLEQEFKINHTTFQIEKEKIEENCNTDC